MKRLAAILLMSILFFNWYGYRILSVYLENRSDLQLEASLDDNNYDESQLVSFKVPSTHLSYYNSSTQFERVDGQIDIDGVRYNYVKRRLFNDSVELLCIPNHTVMGLQTARNEFFKQVNDLQQHNGQDKKTGSHPGASKNLSTTDYYTTGDLITLHQRYFTLLPQSPDLVPAIVTSYFLTAEQPPDLSPAHC